MFHKGDVAISWICSSLPLSLIHISGQVERKWYVVDATDVPLGRLSAVVASVLRGKNKPTFTPHTDTGDFVIVINAEKVKLTGKKATDKIYYTHSMYPGGLDVYKRQQ